MLTKVCRNICGWIFSIPATPHFRTMNFSLIVPYYAEKHNPLRRIKSTKFGSAEIMDNPSTWNGLYAKAKAARRRHGNLIERKTELGIKIFCAASTARLTRNRVGSDRWVRYIPFLDDYLNLQSGTEVSLLKRCSCSTHAECGFDADSTIRCKREQCIPQFQKWWCKVSFNRYISEKGRDSCFF